MRIFILFLLFFINQLVLADNIINIKNNIISFLKNNLNFDQYQNIKDIKINIDDTDLIDIKYITNILIDTEQIKSYYPIIIYAIDKKDKNIIKKIFAKIKINCYIVASSKTIIKGSKITENDIVLKDTDVLVLNSIPFYNKNEVINKISNKVIPLNKPILHNDIDEDLIKVGDIINITYQKDNLLIIDKARAEESGSLNEIIKVRNIKSKKLLNGRIISRYSVNIEDII